MVRKTPLLLRWDHFSTPLLPRSPALSDFPRESSSGGLGWSQGPPGQLADRAPWDSGLDPGVQEAGDTGAVTVGPQIPHSVAPALVSGRD